MTQYLERKTHFFLFSHTTSDTKYVGNSHIKQFFPTLTGCPAISLSFDTICLELAQTLQVPQDALHRGSNPECGPCMLLIDYKSGVLILPPQVG
jgi:hypothetical protein